MLRVIIVRAGLPEPLLNVDLHDEGGRFLGCVDMVYPDARVIIEYHGHQHSATWARDVERMAALRAAGWNVVEVTAELIAAPEELTRRIRLALGR